MTTPDPSKIMDRYCKARVLADDPRTPPAEADAARRFAEKLASSHPDLALPRAFEEAKRRAEVQTRQPDIDIEAILRDPSRYMGDPAVLNKAASIIFEALKDPERHAERRTIFSQAVGKMTDSYLSWLGSRLAARADDLMDEILAWDAEEDDDMADDDTEEGGIGIEVEDHEDGIAVTLTGDPDDIIAALKDTKSRREIIDEIEAALDDEEGEEDDAGE